MTHRIISRHKARRRAAMGFIAYSMAALLTAAGCADADTASQTSEAPQKSAEAIFIEFADSAPNQPIAATAAPTAESVGKPIPSRIEKTCVINGVEVVFDAAVIPPKQQSYPVYRLHRGATQDFTDRAMTVLFDGNPLYTETDIETKDYYADLIETYTFERDHAANGEQRQRYEEWIELYTERQKTAPESATLTAADTTLRARETQETAMAFGDAVKTADGGTRYEWSETARQRAEEAGYSSMSGIGWKQNGRKMVLSVENTPEHGRIWFGPPEGETDEYIPAPLTYGVEQAEDYAEELLASLGIEAGLLSVGEHFHEDGSRRLYTLDYRVRFAGQGDEDAPRIGRVASAAIPGLYAYSDVIRISMDGSGILAFTWDDCVSVDAVVSENAPLLPWETIEAEIARGLEERIEGIVPETYRESASFKGETFHIDTVRFAVRQTRIGGVWYSLPVWELTGTLAWAFDPARYTGQLPLDENGVYTGFDPANNDGLIYSFLTVPAVEMR